MAGQKYQVQRSINMKTVSVGIPTFNESANIKNLVQGLLDQHQSGFRLDSIIVSDDNSTDGTQNIVSNIKNKKIILLENKQRGGIAKRLNQIFSVCKSDYLLVLNGDVSISDRLLLKKMISNSVENDIDLLAGDLKELPSNSQVARSLAIARKAKDLLYESSNGGDNWYTCHGPIRLFSKKLYSNMILSFGVGEDMYSYYFAKKHGYKYGYTKDVFVLFKQPESLNDHIKQSTRFTQTKKIIEKEFGREFVNNLKPKIKIFSIFKSLFYSLVHPFSMAIYIFSLGFVFLQFSFTSNSDQKFDTWTIANSSKK